MNLQRLIFKEISHRPWSFVLSVVSVAVAALVLVASDLTVRHNGLATSQILEETQAKTAALLNEKEAVVAAAGADLEETMRKSMKELGFNVLILPERQDPSELHLTGGLSETMPESYAQRLGDSKIMTINHLLPTVLKKITWPEQQMEIVLYGTRGEVPLMHRALKKPVLDAVAPGQMVVGWNIHRKLNLEVGQEILFHERTFRISQLQPERGSIDDVTIWIDLQTAQEILGLQNLLHAILALECECVGDRVSQIRQEIGQILPGTQVIERYSQALARAEARAKAKEVADKSLADEQAAAAATMSGVIAQRQQLELQHRQVAGSVTALVLLVTAIMVGVMAYVNARQRREEVGILRALGLRTKDILMVFLGKACLIGCLGGVCGVVLGFFVTPLLILSPTADSMETIRWPVQVYGWFLFAPLLTLVLAVVASWLAAAIAASQDVALTLQGE